jgi:hypothetical protein
LDSKIRQLILRHDARREKQGEQKQQLFHGGTVLPHTRCLPRTINPHNNGAWSRKKTGATVLSIKEWRKGWVRLRAGASSRMRCRTPS